MFKLRPWERLLYDGTIAAFRATKRWQFPIDASGDLETMTLRDKVYWLYKASYPMTHARKGSGVEAYFAERLAVRASLPSDFAAEAELQLSAVGDLMDHPFLSNSLDTLYSDAAEAIFGVDVSMANLECVLYDTGSAELTFSPRHGPPLRYKPASFDVVKGAGAGKYTFFATACNHSLDFGGEGVASTIRSLRAEGIAFHGVNESETDAGKATILERSGFRLALLSHTFGLNAHQPPTDKPWIVNRTRLNEPLATIDFRRLREQLEHARREAVDATIVHLHWGLEHEFYPMPAQLDVAHHIAELGADVLIGHHPHVVQPFEVYRTQREPERLVPIFYSLGNLVNPFSAPHLCASHVARIVLAKGRTRDGAKRTYAKEAIVLDAVQHVDEPSRKLRISVAAR